MLQKLLTPAHENKSKLSSFMEWLLERNEDSKFTGCSPEYIWETKRRSKKD